MRGERAADNRTGGEAADHARGHPAAARIRRLGGRDSGDRNHTCGENVHQSLPHDVTSRDDAS
jgi:hypothetical protein